MADPYRIPTPVKAFARQFSGNQEPITETFFQPQEITTLADLIAQSERRLQPVGFTPTNRDEWMEIHGYEPGLVNYGDYAELERKPGADFLESLLPTRATSDAPLESLRHTLGNFAYREVVDPTTGEIQYKVTDEYNWDPVYGDYGLADTYGMKEGGGRYPQWKDLPNIIAGRAGPAKIGERSKNKYTAAQRLSNLVEWAGGMFGPRSSEGEGMRFDVTVPTGRYAEPSLENLMANEYMEAEANRPVDPLAQAMVQIPGAPNLTTGLKDDELLRHHYKNIAEGKTKENDDGSLSTVYSRQVNHPDLNDGKPTLIPSVWDGKILNEDAAVRRAIDSKRKWTTRDTHEELRALDIMLHQDMRPDTTKEEAKRRISDWNKE